jgi:hypothetical protein
MDGEGEEERQQKRTHLDPEAPIEVILHRLRREQGIPRDDDNPDAAQKQLPGRLSEYRKPLLFEER